MHHVKRPSLAVVIDLASHLLFRFIHFFYSHSFWLTSFSFILDTFIGFSFDWIEVIFYFVSVFIFFVFGHAVLLLVMASFLFILLRSAPNKNVLLVTIYFTFSEAINFGIPLLVQILYTYKRIPRTSSIK